MFALIKRLFRREDAAYLVTREAIDIISRYQHFRPDERYAVTSAFEYTKSRLEIDHGEIDIWDMQHKADVAKQVLKFARESYGHSPHGACGVALVGLYLEAQTLAGDKARRLVDLIDEWHRRAIVADLKTDRIR